MGVNYCANFEIGVQVTLNSQTKEQLEQLGKDFPTLVDCVDEILERLNHPYFYSFSAGEGMWIDVENDVFICIKKSFKEISQNLVQYETELLQFIQHNGLEPVGEIGLVGGLYTY